MTKYSVQNTWVVQISIRFYLEIVNTKFSSGYPVNIWYTLQIISDGCLSEFVFSSLVKQERRMKT